ncbi:conserved Plasmodium protein, unknown function [Plasmodium sp. DRC-Itaito]|nr:conserved Plasmodium protein, unknown function [Plasmodium sp. DRC-Itaito]
MSVPNNSFFVVKSNEQISCLLKNYAEERKKKKKKMDQKKYNTTFVGDHARKVVQKDSDIYRNNDIYRDNNICRNNDIYRDNNICRNNDIYRDNDIYRNNDIYRDNNICRNNDIYKHNNICRNNNVYNHSYKNEKKKKMVRNSFISEKEKLNILENLRRINISKDDDISEISPQKNNLFPCHSFYINHMNKKETQYYEINKDDIKHLDNYDNKEEESEITREKNIKNNNKINVKNNNNNNVIEKEKYINNENLFFKEDILNDQKDNVQNKEYIKKKKMNIIYDDNLKRKKHISNKYMCNTEIMYNNKKDHIKKSSQHNNNNKNKKTFSAKDTFYSTKTQHGSKKTMNYLSHMNLERGEKTTLKEKEKETYISLLKEKEKETYISPLKEKEKETYISPLKEKEKETYISPLKEKKKETYISPLKGIKKGNNTGYLKTEENKIYKDNMNNKNDKKNKTHNNNNNNNNKIDNIDNIDNIDKHDNFYNHHKKDNINNSFSTQYGNNVNKQNCYTNNIFKLNNSSFIKRNKDKYSDDNVFLSNDLINSSNIFMNNNSSNNSLKLTVSPSSSNIISSVSSYETKRKKKKNGNTLDIIKETSNHNNLDQIIENNNNNNNNPISKNLTTYIYKNNMKKDIYNRYNKENKNIPIIKLDISDNIIKYTKVVKKLKRNILCIINKFIQRDDVKKKNTHFYTHKNFIKFINKIKKIIKNNKTKNGIFYKESKNIKKNIYYIFLEYNQNVLLIQKFLKKKKILRKYINQLFEKHVFPFYNMSNENGINQEILEQMKKEKKLFLENIFSLNKKSSKNMDILQFLPKNKKEQINYTNYKYENINKTNDIFHKRNVCEHLSHLLNNKNKQEEHSNLDSLYKTQKNHSSSLKEINRYYSEKLKKNYNNYNKGDHKNDKQNYCKKYPNISSSLVYSNVKKSINTNNNDNNNKNICNNNNNKNIYNNNNNKNICNNNNNKNIYNNNNNKNIYNNNNNNKNNLNYRNSYANLYFSKNTKLINTLSDEKKKTKFLHKEKNSNRQINIRKEQKGNQINTYEEDKKKDTVIFETNQKVVDLMYNENDKMDSQRNHINIKENFKNEMNTTKILENLSNVNMSNEKLSDVNMSNEKLSDVNMCNEKLSNVNMCNEKLSNVNMCNEKLSDVNMDNEKLSGVNMDNEKLSHVNMDNEKLSGANMANEKLSGANMSNENLSSVNMSNKKLSNKKLTNEVLIDHLELNKIRIKKVVSQNNLNNISSRYTSINKSIVENNKLYHNLIYHQDRCVNMKNQDNLYCPYNNVNPGNNNNIMNFSNIDNIKINIINNSIKDNLNENNYYLIDENKKNYKGMNINNMDIQQRSFNKHNEHLINNKIKIIKNNKKFLCDTDTFFYENNVRPVKIIQKTGDNHNIINKIKKHISKNYNNALVFLKKQIYKTNWLIHKNKKKLWESPYVHRFQQKIKSHLANIRSMSHSFSSNIKQSYFNNIQPSKERMHKLNHPICNGPYINSKVCHLSPPHVANVGSPIIFRRRKI